MQKFTLYRVSLAVLMTISGAGCSSADGLLRDPHDPSAEGVAGLVLFIHLKDRMVLPGGDSAKFLIPDSDSVVMEPVNKTEESESYKIEASDTGPDPYYDTEDPYFTKAETGEESEPEPEENPAESRKSRKSRKNGISLIRAERNGGWYYAVILDQRKGPYYLRSLRWTERFSSGRRKSYITYNVPLYKKQSSAVLTVVPEPGKIKFLGIYAVQIRTVDKGIGLGLGDERRAFLVPAAELLIKTAPENIKKQIFGAYSMDEEGARKRFFDLLKASYGDETGYWKTASEVNSDAD